MSPLLRRLGALGVDDRGTRARFASSRLADRDIERLVDTLQRAVPIPQLKIEMSPCSSAADLSAKPAIQCSDQHIFLAPAGSAVRFRFDQIAEVLRSLTGDPGGLFFEPGGDPSFSRLSIKLPPLSILPWPTCNWIWGE
jgi:hypothetical protein